MAGTRAMGVLIAESLAKVETVVTMPQLRVLILASVAPLNVSAVAEDLGVHPSNATRTCDRLVRAGLLDRNPDPADRRHVMLTATEEGRRLVQTVMDHRRSRVEQILQRLDEEQRAALAVSLAAFTAAVGEEHLGLEAVVVQP
ncbi:MarR family transcriptional regulator [Nocardioides mesophilus]|uniref:MarR family transcriptional regulator n=2 Tax=Nocardioides mesophilus TaxID=433659 RepID=A0A7G9RHL2_9ACTN|nr:MarR family transcriptional regulator [Nocardioides mesophilus]